VRGEGYGGKERVLSSAKLGAWWGRSTGWMVLYYWVYLLS